MPWNRPVMARFLTAVVFVGVFGGLLSGNQWVLALELSHAQAGRATPASVEDMQLLRDEHDLIADMVKTQLAATGSGFDSNPAAAVKRYQAIALR
jgi:hypothetical protein